ncbi:hypothetical protein CL614_10510 [archaeon]|nr:hypothetical protein [archaeon]
MSKNIIYMVAIDHHTSQFKVTDYCQPSIDSWKSWCKKHNVEFYLNSEHDKRFDKPIWNKELVFEKIGDSYDKIGIVDADTMPRWDMPNIFDLYSEDDFCGVIDNDNLGYLNHSISAYKKFFPGVNLDMYSYINAGVIFFSKKHKKVFDHLLEFYYINKEEIDNWNIPNTGREQTIFNFVLEKLKIKKKFLPPSYNLIGMVKKDMFHHNWTLGDKTPYFMKYGLLWHFTGFPIEERIRIMNEIWVTYKDKWLK